jgi:hypothetical protein
MITMGRELRMVVLHWKDTLTGKVGHGDPTDYANGVKWMKHMNKRAAERKEGYEYWLEDVETETAEQPPL